MAGHSKWANIKHKKAKADAQKGKLYTKIAREIIMAAKQGGGDPEANFALRIAIDKARSMNLPNENINRAIQRGVGAQDGDNYESFSYEGYGPGGVAIIVDLLSDNRNRTASDIRHLFSKHGGNMGETGCVSYMFDRKGVILIDREKEAHSEDDMLLIALEAGAEDLQIEEDSFQIITAPDELETVRRSLQEQGVQMESAELSMLPQTMVAVDGEVAEKALKLLNALEDHDDVQNVYTNADIEDVE
ncbi:MAG: YebC/PmpR family DNA-binding transcriptional regulator [Bacillota bacterium]|jgi:YebC/PmpR family DNA-binding regulatory protein